MGPRAAISHEIDEEGVCVPGVVPSTYSLKTGDCRLGWVGAGSSAPAQLVGSDVHLVWGVGDAHGLAGLQGRADEPAGEGG